MCFALPLIVILLFIAMNDEPPIVILVASIETPGSSCLYSIMNAFPSSFRILCSRRVTLPLLLLCWWLAHSGVAANFQPYQLNGGLVAAVAGRDFVVIAADTRLIGSGGYDILERQHTSSRLWTPTIPSDDTDNNKSRITSRDGSLQMPSAKHITATYRNPPIWIGSAGCQADCEMLKRVIRADVRAGHYFGEPTAPPSQVATLLSQVLYSRRGFPYYSFCVVAGIEQDNGRVYVYDAIGSYEQVAVASTGTGRELLQPILDRMFRTLVVEEDTEKPAVVQSFRSGSTLVSCSSDEAVSILVEAYRSVAEREIGVGDHVVFCVVKRHATRDEYECTTCQVPLKKH